jgi:hypothetical protein
MTSVRRDEDSKQSRRLLSRRLILLIIIILVASIAFCVWFFFISGLTDNINKSANYLPPDCYSINGKQICPSKS